MTLPKIPPPSKGLAEVILWIPVGLFLALGIAWAIYPRIYLHSHPGLPWPVIPERWRAYADSSPALVYFFLAAMTAAFGLWQTQFCYRFGRDSSKILLFLYLLSSLVFAGGSWTFDLGSRFWTVSMQNEVYPPDRILEIGRMLVKFGLYSSLGAAFLNVTYSSFKRSA
jgi:hypothetical protein